MIRLWVMHQIRRVQSTGSDADTVTDNRRIQRWIPCQIQPVRFSVGLALPEAVNHVISIACFDKINNVSSYIIIMVDCGVALWKAGRGGTILDILYTATEVLIKEG
jgi:hypothetical protein